MGFERRDYLKKQIDQLGRVLGKMLADMLGLKQQGQVGEAMQLVDETMQRVLSLNLISMIAVSPRELVVWLRQEHQFQPEHLAPMADILYESAEGFLLQKDTATARALWERAQAIYEHLEATETTFSLERHYRIAQIKSLLS
jgi:hypothetical protein